MQNQVMGWVGVVIVVLGLARCGRLVPREDCQTGPQTLVPDTPNSVDNIIGDMTLPHEGKPHGVPATYEWAKGPTVHTGRIPERFRALTAWGQLYEDQCGNRAANTRVQIRGLKVYVMSRADGDWHLLQRGEEMQGAAYFEGFVPPIGVAGDMREESEGGISARAGNGYNFHFFPSHRAAIEPEDVVAVWISIQARLVLDESGKPDDRLRARYLLNVGADLWRDTVVEHGREEDNPELGMGRFKYVTTGWQWFNMLYIESGIDKRWLEGSPPPF